jgi:murein DD-endopeptidase MepM/ murein hydrolase activator NlpD
MKVNAATVAVCAAVSTVIVGCGILTVAPLAGLLTAGEVVTAVTGASLQCGDRQGVVTVAMSTPNVDGYTAEQTRNALTIVQVGQEMAVPPRALVIAIATALQESALHNYGDLGSRNDHDSLGLFQQRPSTGWGTPEQVRDPRYASRAFYTALLKVSNWQSLPLTVAAQRVQGSAFPNAYAKHEAAASRIVDAISKGAPSAGPVSGTCAPAGQVAASGWVVPVKAPIVSSFRPPSRPTHNGVDLGATRRTPIHAAAAGTVIKAICQPATAAARGSCDVDGSPATPGCGWYVDIQHDAGIITRYCHMVQQPAVKAGDHVAAGQEIGLVGTSGNSSGPHLHFEVHRNGDASSAGAIDPVPFMAEHGAALEAAKTT